MTNGFTGNGELEQLAGDKLPVKQLPIDEVDKLADELVAEYDNPAWRPWYCRTIYRFGLEQVAEWRRKSAGGRKPGGLFGYYVRQAEASAGINAVQQPASPRPSGFVPDIIHPLSDDKTAAKVSENIDQTLQETQEPIDLPAWNNTTGSPGAKQ